MQKKDIIAKIIIIIIIIIIIRIYVINKILSLLFRNYTLRLFADIIVRSIYKCDNMSFFRWDVKSFRLDNREKKCTWNRITLYLPSLNLYMASFSPSFTGSWCLLFKYYVWKCQLLYFSFILNFLFLTWNVFMWKIITLVYIAKLITVFFFFLCLVLII